MRLNLGCGDDIRDGYVNVDLYGKCDVRADLTVFPWPFADSSVEEVMMLDFLEHVPWAKTEDILRESWRVLVSGGQLVVQVPDAEHCCRALGMIRPFMCNSCGWEFPEDDLRANFFMCGKCSRSWDEIALAAAHRMFGGQDRPGNWHHMGFSQLLLRQLLLKNGFDNIKFLEKNERGETFWQNWNMKAVATKKEDLWR